MKNFDMDNMNPEIAAMIRKAMSDPELIKGIAEGLMGGDTGTEDAVGAMIDGVMTEIKDSVARVNDVIETSEAYDELRDEIVLLIENVIMEVATVVATLYTSWYENSEEIDVTNANLAFRKYQAYLDAGFNEQQAFSLISKENKSADSTSINNLINRFATELNKRNKN